jgi:alkylation response protein AidB-like acyl-CoA dehydrogenase
VDAARVWFEDNWDPDLTLGEWWDRLVESGWGFPGFPSQWFGKDLSLPGVWAVDEERRRAGAAAAPNRIGAAAISPLLVEYATQDQLRRYLHDTLTDRAVWCELFSEPGAGSDLAGLSTRAAKSGDEWIVNGQKVWSSGAEFARWGLLLARTDPGVPKQGGLTCFVIEMDQPGVDVRPLVTMTGEAEFNEVFLTDARVEGVVGAEGDGWRLVKEALAHERRAMGSGGLGDNSRRPDLSQRAGDVAERERSGRRSGGLSSGSEELLRTLLASGDGGARHEAMRLYELLRIARFMSARRVDASVQRLMTSRIARAQRDLYLRLEGAAGMLAGADAPLGGVVQRLALWSPAMSIMLGTDEVQHTIVGERVLGLPAEPSLDRGVAWRDVRRS